MIDLCLSEMCRRHFKEVQPSCIFFLPEYVCQKLTRSFARTERLDITVRLFTSKLVFYTVCVVGLRLKKKLLKLKTKRGNSTRGVWQEDRGGDIQLEIGTEVMQQQKGIAISSYSKLPKISRVTKLYSTVHFEIDEIDS